MRLLVTGGCGFIGSNFIRYMIEKYENVRIVNVDKLSYGSNIKNLRGVDGSRHELIKGDICDRELMRKLLGSVDAIVNFAAETHVDRSIADPYPFLKSNVEGVVSILEALRSRRDVRLVHISTDEVYGDVERGSFRESDRL
ncbi:MAG: GDP-mannose 4,6-dehydratase, partial [Candidatus Nezhaarchaeales archaeon]